MPNPMKDIFNLFPNGRWLNVYEVPFFGNEYLKADQFINWQTGDISQKLSQDCTNFLKERFKYKFAYTANISAFKFRSGIAWYNLDIVLFN